MGYLIKGFVLGAHAPVITLPPIEITFLSNASLDANPNPMRKIWHLHTFVPASTHRIASKGFPPDTGVIYRSLPLGLTLKDKSLYVELYQATGKNVSGQQSRF